MVVFRVAADDGLCKFREVVEVLILVSVGAGGAGIGSVITSLFPGLNPSLNCLTRCAT